jgi:hypothetical protein
MNQQQREERREYMYGMISLWKKSGLSQNKFCQQENIPSRTFRTWVKKYKQETNPVSDPIFMQVQTPMSCSVISDMITMICPNGVRIEFPMGVSVETIGTLVKQL